MGKTVAKALAACSAMIFGLAYFPGNGLADEPMGTGDFAVLSPLEAQNLDEMRGRDGDTSIMVQSTQSLEATVNGSTIQANTVASGGVTIGEHALDNFSGVGLFNIVTGNNNAVDAAIGVTFNLQ